jgi:hypothetical protein
MICPAPHFKDSTKYGDPADGFKLAFMDAIDEYNSFGFAATNPKYRVEQQAALELYGFKVTWICLHLPFISYLGPVVGCSFCSDLLLVYW